VNDPALQNLRFLIAGHTDSSGSDACNMALSQRRADAVVTYLVDKGVAPGRLVAKGFGESDPLDGRPDDPANRRVEARMAE
jgi:outer membrane protein OmpA-like peptidoglycan-associated protein